MKNIQLKSIALKEWKGRNIEINFNQDQPTTITGRNGIGKTSVMKAFLWLLTGRTDAAGKVNGELFDNTKELSQDTPPAIVEATISIDGVEHTLMRSARAKFKRPKGQTEWVKDSSDEYKFSVDGLPYNATDYNGWIAAQISDTDLLPICILGEVFSNFTENDRAKARKVLTDLIGERVPDAHGYPEIESELSMFSASEIAEMCRTNTRASSDELTKIPAQISVHQQTLQELKDNLFGFDTDYDRQIKELTNQIEQQREKVNKKNEESAETNKTAKELTVKKSDLEKRAAEARADVDKMALQAAEKEKQIALLEDVTNLGKSVCPTCGSLISLSDEELREKKDALALAKDALGIICDKITSRDNEAYNLEKEAAGIVVPEFVTPDTTAEQNEIQRLNDLLAEAKVKKAEQDGRKQRIAAEESAIEALENSRKEYGSKLAEWERKKIELERYVQDAANMLSEEVNGNLKDTKIQMFETQKNGEQKPSCVITNADGVKYSTLNFSARMLCNIEIGRMFCRLLDVNLPCFVDECSVFDSKHLPIIDGTQMIYMRCSDDQKLVVL